MALKDWKKTGVLDKGEWIMWETKKKSKTYKGQPRDILILQKHPMNKKMWTVQYGQALINMPMFKTKEEALKYAKDYMKNESKNLKKKNLKEMI